MATLVGPNDLQLWLGDAYLLGKEWSRGFVCNTVDTFEEPRELWKYYWRDNDGVAGTGPTGNNSAAVLTPGVYDTSLRSKKSIPDTLPFTATHHALMVERRAVTDGTAANDYGCSERNLLQLEARVWYELYLKDDQNPIDQGLVTEFPPGFGPEGDFTTTDRALLRTGKNDLSAVRLLPRKVQMAKGDQIRAVLRPCHGVTAFIVETAIGAGRGAVGVRNFVYWFKGVGQV